METLEKIIDWLCNEHTYRFFEGNGFALILSCFVVTLLILLVISKKFRKFVFKKLF